MAYFTTPYFKLPTFIVDLRRDVYPCDKPGYCIRVLDFFPYLKLFAGFIWTSGLISSGTLFHELFKFLRVSGQRGLEVTNMPAYVFESEPELVF